MRNTRTATAPDCQVSVELLCLHDAREHVAASVEEAFDRCQKTGGVPGEAVIRKAEVAALIQLVAGVMALNAELSARLARVENGGLLARLRRWWCT